MRSSFMKIILLVFVAFFVFAGIATAITNVTDQVIVERIPYKSKIFFASVNVYQDGDNVIVSGRLKRDRFSMRRFNGHVDVAIISPDGQTISSTSVKYTPRFRSTRTQRRAYRKTRFKASFSEKLQKGSTVRVTLHKRDGIKIAKGFDCGNNIALPE